jgi:hypothetical protein
MSENKENQCLISKNTIGISQTHNLLQLRNQFFLFTLQIKFLFFN